MVIIIFKNILYLKIYQNNFFKKIIFDIIVLK